MWVDLQKRSRREVPSCCGTGGIVPFMLGLFLFVPKAGTDAGFLTVWFVIVVLTTVTVFIYNRYFKAGFNSFFGRRPAAWIVGIWLALILFGVWYFSNVPGPYTMPY